MMKSHLLREGPDAIVSRGNLVLWSAGPGLQILLLLVLVLRGIAGRLWSFTLLLSFYAARSLLLFLLFGHIGRASYAALYEAAGWADIALRLLVFAEIAMPLARGKAGGAARRALLLLLGVLLAGAAAWALPSGGPLPVDRGSAFTSLLMILLALFRVRLGGFARRVVGGLAAYGAVAIAADVVRSQAAVMRNRTAWVGAAYVESGAWLLVLLFWLIAFFRERSAGGGQGKTRPDFVD